MPKFKPVQRQSRISHEVIEQIKQSILFGDFKTGDRLPPERDLAEEFHVSRAVIREALRALENSGFVVTRQGVTGGAYIIDLSFQQLINAFLDLFISGKISMPELHHVRRLIEPDVARLAATRVTPEYTQMLKEALEAEKLPTTSAAEEVDRKTTVHFVLAEMCGNRFLEALVRSVVGLSKKVVETIDADPRPLHPVGMHVPIVDAVLSGDPEKAAGEMEKHAIEFGNNLIQLEKTFRQKKSKAPY